MGLIYGTGNLITASTLDSVTSEDALYVKEFLYNQRPSYPFRFTAKTGNQILVDLGGATSVTLVSVLNHNLDSPTLFKIKAAAADPPGGGNWDAPDFEDDLTLCTGIRNSYLKISESYRYWLLDIDDAGNSDNIEIGEFILTTHSNFGSVFHVVDKSEGSIIHATSQRTHYGQPWDVKLSEQKKWELGIIEETTKGLIDAVETFLQDLEGAAGRFVFIPDDTYCHSYYVLAEGTSFIARHIFHNTKDLRNWSLPLLEHPNGVSLT